MPASRRTPARPGNAASTEWLIQTGSSSPAPGTSRISVTTSLRPDNIAVEPPAAASRAANSSNGSRSSGCDMGCLPDLGLLGGVVGQHLVLHVVEVLFHHGRRALGIAFEQLLDDLAVLLQGLVDPRRDGRVDLLEDRDLGPDAVDDRVEALVLGGRDQPAMEAAVGLQERVRRLLQLFWRLGVAQEPLDVLELEARALQLLLAVLAADPPRRETLEGETELEDLLEVALAKGGDEEAAVRLGNHDTVLNQLVQRLADRCAADAELIAEAQVRQLLAGFQLLAEDAVAKDAVDIRPQVSSLD